MKLRTNICQNWVESRNWNFLKLLEPDLDAKVIDLGCGDGGFSLKVKERISCNRMCRINVHEPYINKARMIENNTFNIVVSNQVIEHLFYLVKFSF